MTVAPHRAVTRVGRRRGAQRAANPRHTLAVSTGARHATSSTTAAPETAPSAPHTQSGEFRLASDRRGHRYLRAAVLRSTLYLGPLSVAVAAGGTLAQVAWPVPVIAVLLGWTAAQGLTSAGVAVGRRAGTATACRLVGGGFTALAGVWSTLVWAAPANLLGGHRGLALVIGLGALATLATVTAALVTRAETAIIRWCLPCWLLAGAALADRAGAPVPGLPVDTLLPAAIVMVLIRAFRPAMMPGGPRRSYQPTRAEMRRAAGFLAIGAAQTVLVGLLWWAAADQTTTPFWLPFLLSVPILEALIGWHIGRIEAGRARHVTLLTLAGLLPPFAIGAALAVAAFRLPSAPAVLGGAQSGELLSTMLGDAQPDLLALAGGTLLGGVFAITSLLAARGRLGVAILLAALPPLSTTALAVRPQATTGALPDAIGVLAVTHLAGLLVVALTLADHRRRS